MIVVLSDCVFKGGVWVYVYLFDDMPQYLSWPIFPVSTGTLFGTTLFLSQRYTFSDYVYTNLRTSRCLESFKWYRISWHISLAYILDTLMSRIIYYAFTNIGMAWCVYSRGLLFDLQLSRFGKSSIIP